MGVWEEHGLTSYPDYFNTKHWQHLKEDLLWKRGAHCFVCERVNRLLPHHVSYDNLFHEKLYKDIFILCFDCHQKTHFWFTTMKIPLSTNWLLFSMRVRRVQYLLQKHRFGLSLLWLSLIIATVPVNLLLCTLSLVFRLLGKALWWLTRTVLSDFGIEVR